MPFIYKPGGLENQFSGLPQIDPSMKAYMRDAATSASPTPPMTAGFFRLEKDEPANIEYEFDEVKLFLGGECTITDETGAKVTARAGDVLFFNKGTKATFQAETGSHALAFYCAQRAKL